MKTPKWTRADAKRAEKMGWKLRLGLEEPYIQRHGDRFKSDDEAINAVINQVMVASARLGAWVEDVELDAKTNTCIKALFLCAKG